MMRRIALLASFAVIVVTASSAQAALTITSFTASTASTLAGGHSDATVAFAFQTTLGESTITTGGTARDVVVKLPAGFVGIARDVPQCPVETFRVINCPADTQIGTGTVRATGYPHLRAEVYDLATSPNQAAVLGLQVHGLGNLGQALISASAHAADGYAVTLSVPETPRPFGVWLLSSSLTVWGVPADPSHDALRACRQTFGDGEPNEYGCASDAPRLAFLENPTDCSTAPVTSLSVNTYQEPDVFATRSFAAPNPTECQTVPFAPTISLAPRPEEYPGSDSTQAGAPTGLAVDLSVPQNEDPSGQGTSELKSAVVILPRGMVISPSVAANGLQACSDAEFGAGLDTPAQCPPASQIATSEVLTPLLSGPLDGKVYLGQPLSTDPTSGQMFRLFQEFQGFGLDIKIQGSAVADPATGQLTATFANLPELPFQDFKLHFNGGPNAVLVNPPTCGANTTTTQLAPYSNSTQPATPSSTFATSFDGNGAPCPTVLPFVPSSSIATASSQGGALSPLSVTFARADETQPLGQITAHLPPGLLGNVSAVALCDPADAAAGTCPVASRVGVESATSGAGSDPLTVPGTIYLARGTGGYPFAISVVVPAIAGPYNLGNVVVLVNLQVNSDGSITAVSGPLPSILDGIPLDIRSVTMTIDRPGFTFNPTNCGPLSMGGTATSLSDSVAPISAPFQASGCGSLPFAPSLTVATQGSTSKANGASLTVRIAQKAGEADIHSVHVELPRQLPSRLTTLQKACTEAEFASNPAGCPAGSVVGTATAITPTLSTPMTGPAFLVSHGRAAFPDLEIVLQGEGVTVVLDGATDIKHGITSSTFASAPDVPLSGFELTLPQGPYSLLAANATLCTSKLLIPTTIVGWSGLMVKQSTRIAVSGCPKVKVLSANVKGATAALTVQVPAAGRLTISGSGLKQAARTSKRAGSATVEVALSRAGLASVHRHRRLRVKLTAYFTLSTSSSSSAFTTLTFR